MNRAQRNDYIGQAVANLENTVLPERKSYYCQSQILYILAGVCVLIAGMLALGMTAKDLLDLDEFETKRKTDSNAKLVTMSPKTRGMLNLAFAVLIAMGGIIFIAKGRCVSKMIK